MYAPWYGKNKTIKKPAKFIAAEDFYFGGKLIPKGSICKQFETTNFGWTVWIEPEGKTGLARF
jgi:hypothetical protein